MKTQFFEYYRPTDAEFNKLWKECMFAFDANMLLNLYRYNSETREKFIEILNLAKERIWEPHQAVLEYFKRRLDVIHGQEHAYERIRQLTEKSKNKFLSEAAEFSKHSTIDIKQIQRDIEKAFDNAATQISDIEETHPNFFEDDPTLTTLTEILDGRVGPAYSDEILSQKYKLIDQRYTRNIPPGYKDTTKDGDLKYGDAILWMQLLEWAKENSIPIVFVTDDLKEDWWYIHNRKTIGPRPELRKEMKDVANVEFYMYSSSQFFEHASKMFKRRVKKEIVDDIQKTGESKFGKEWTSKEIKMFSDSVLLTSIEEKENKIRSLVEGIKEIDVEMDMIRGQSPNIVNTDEYKNLLWLRSEMRKKLNDERKEINKMMNKMNLFDSKLD